MKTTFILAALAASVAANGVDLGDSCCTSVAVDAPTSAYDCQTTIINVAPYLMSIDEVEERCTEMGCEWGTMDGDECKVQEEPTEDMCCNGLNADLDVMCSQWTNDQPKCLQAVNTCVWDVCDEPVEPNTGGDEDEGCCFSFDMAYLSVCHGSGTEKCLGNPEFCYWETNEDKCEAVEDLLSNGPTEVNGPTRGGKGGHQSLNGKGAGSLGSAGAIGGVISGVVIAGVAAVVAFNAKKNSKPSKTGDVQLL